MLAHDASKAYFAVLRPPPQKANLMVVDLKRMQILKEIHAITHDLRSMATTMNGKYLLIIFGGFHCFMSALTVRLICLVC